MTIKQAISREPATILGFLIGVAVFLLVRYGHLDASTADELALAVVPVVGGIITRQFVTPVTSKAGAAATVDDVVAVLQQIRNALTVPAPAPALPAGVTTEETPATTSQVITDESAKPLVTIPAAPEPWTPPSLDIPPILGAMTATPAAAYVAPAPETPPTV